MPLVDEGCYWSSQVSLQLATCRPPTSIGTLRPSGEDGKKVSGVRCDQINLVVLCQIYLLSVETTTSRVVISKMTNTAEGVAWRVV